MSPIACIVWLIVGGVAGWLASLVMKTNRQQGLITDIAVGIVGSFVGGFVFNLLNINIGGGIIGSVIVAFVGAVIFLAILRAVRR